VKSRFRESLTVTLATSRPDLSAGHTLQLSGARFVAVRIGHDAPASNAAVFASDEGEFFAIATASDRAGAGRNARALGPNALLLSVQPQWSFIQGSMPTLLDPS
jgi:hypothetical protein